MKQNNDNYFDQKHLLFSKKIQILLLFQNVSESAIKIGLKTGKCIHVWIRLRSFFTFLKTILADSENKVKIKFVKMYTNDIWIL